MTRLKLVRGCECQRAILVRSAGPTVERLPGAINGLICSCSKTFADVFVIKALCAVGSSLICSCRVYYIVESGLFEQSVGNRAAARLYCCRDYSNSLSACMCHATSGVCTCIVAGTVLSHNYKDCLVFTIVYSPHVEGVLLYICGANLKGNTLRVLVLS